MVVTAVLPIGRDKKPFIDAKWFLRDGFSPDQGHQGLNNAANSRVPPNEMNSDDEASGWESDEHTWHVGQHAGQVVGKRQRLCEPKIEQPGQPRVSAAAGADGSQPGIAPLLPPSPHQYNLDIWDAESLQQHPKQNADASSLPSGNVEIPVEEAITPLQRLRRSWQIRCWPHD